MLMNRTRRITLAVIPFVVVLGFACKFYHGPAQTWVNDYGPASVAYVVFWMLLAFLVMPQRSGIRAIAIAVFLFTCGVEFLQLFHPPWLEAIRRTFPGRFVLGTSFSWWDFPAYLIGCGIGAWCLTWIANRAL